MNCELFNHKGKWDNYENYFAYNNHIPYMLQILELKNHMLKLKSKNILFTLGTMVYVFIYKMGREVW
jgi:hypothetical protein